MKAINNYIKEGFYSNVKSDEITLDMLNSYIEDVAKKCGFEFVGEEWKNSQREWDVEPQIRKYTMKWCPGKTYYEIGFTIKENNIYSSELYLYIETWYDDLEKRPRYSIDLKLFQPVPRKSFDSMTARKGFMSKKCTLKWYSSAQEQIEKIIEKLASLERIFESNYVKEVQKNRTFSKLSFVKILNHFSEWLHTY